mgnify:CR=1 FL=1
MQVMLSEKICGGLHDRGNACKTLHENGKKNFGFRILQFNAVVKSNAGALKLYEKLGFVRLGTIPKGFEMNDGHYEDIIPHYHEL